MDNQRQQASERIKQANNILVTVSSNPSVDQLAACIGLTVALNKMGKHATAVFSGVVPSLLGFLQPEKTIEKNTDSLRDFIISLDKSKADKLRYKVEDKVVKIFITPYRTSISDKDLEFSQGDFNVDVVLALGVHTQAELDQAITAHGRILHDAAILTLNIRPGGELGSLNWLDPNASSLSELGVELIDALDKRLMDGQIATAFLTGIVAETERFSNAKTSPQTMSISAELMAAGANQQLVATKLEEPVALPPAPIATQEKPGGTEEMPPLPPKSNDGTLEISHEDKSGKASAEPEVPEEKVLPEPELPEPTPQAAGKSEAEPEVESMPTPEPEALDIPEPKPPAPQIVIDEKGDVSPIANDIDALDLDEALLPPLGPKTPPSISHHNEPPKMLVQPPIPDTEHSDMDKEDELMGLPGMLAEETKEPSKTEALSPPVGPTILPPADDVEPQNAPGTSFLGDQPLTPPAAPPSMPSTNDTASAGALPEPNPAETLSQIEQDVHSSHVNNPTASPPLPPMQPPASPATPPANNAFSPSFNDSILPPVPGPSMPSSFAPPSAMPSPQAAEGQLPNPNPPVVETPAEGTEAEANAHPTLDSARDAVEQAINGGTQPLAPEESLNAKPLGQPNTDTTTQPASPLPASPSLNSMTAAPPPMSPPPMMPNLPPQ